MADQKITALTELAATPDDADILAIVDDVAGTPITKKITVANLLASLNNLFLKHTVATFQTNAATAVGGDVANPATLNDGTQVEYDDATVGTVDQGFEVNFGVVAAIKRFRMFGTGDSENDGVWKIQYKNVLTNAWVDWKTAIPIRNTRDWGAFETVSPVLTQYIRLIATTIDSKGDSYIGELEVIY